MRITVVGAGTAGAFAAGFAKKSFPDAEVYQIYSKDIDILGVGESVTPHVYDFLNRLGVDENTWMKQTGGGFKLGNKFEGWTDKDEYFSFTYNKPIDKLKENAFENLLAVKETDIRLTDVWIDLYNSNKVDSFDNSFNELHTFMKNNKSPFTESGPVSHSPFSHSHHVDAEKLAPWIMKNVNAPLGVIEVESKVTNVLVENNTIKCVELDNGNTHYSDYWLDCTGFNRLLINQLDSTFVEYTDNKCNSAIVMPVELHDPKIYTRSIWNNHGWQFKISLRDRIGTGLVYSDEYFDDNYIKEYFTALEPNGIKEPRIIKWKPGRMAVPAQGNVYAIGIAAGFVEPMEATALFNSVATINKAIDSIKYQDNKVFNDVITYSLDDTALFILAHYTLCEKGNNSFWNDMRKIGEQKQHAKLLLEKYNSKFNTFALASYWYSVFPDYMWVQFASAWIKDLSSWSKYTDIETQNTVLSYFSSFDQNVNKYLNYPEFLKLYHSKQQ